MQILTETETKNILLYVKEVADLYALKTLHDYLAQNVLESRLNARLLFGGKIDSERSRDVLQNIPTREQFQNYSIDAVVSCHSDTLGIGDIEIDISILKNCVVTMSDKDKIELKQRYGVNSQEPVVTIGYALPSSDLIKVVETVTKYATVYLIGFGGMDNYNLSHEAKTKVHMVNKHGVLKDYYAMADVAINAENLYHSSSRLHNFVDATEGGPLFMVPSTNTAQYGYRQLANAGVIVECSSLDDLIRKAETFLRDFEGNTKVIIARTRHLVQSRKSYLPVILAKLMQLIGENASLPDSDLNITQNGRRVRIIHPDSNWT